MIYMVEFLGARIAFHFTHFVNTSCGPRYYTGYKQFRKGTKRHVLGSIDELWCARRERIEGYVVSVFERGKGGYFSPQLFGFKETA